MGYVSGKILIDGAPCENLIVMMKPDDGRTAMVRTDKSGYYSIEYTKGEKGTKIGPTTVSFEWPIGYAAPKSIPSKYVAGVSEIKIDVKKGNNTFDFNIETDATPTTKPPITD